jgi:PadR family transcriptional regulator PadR
MRNDKELMGASTALLLLALLKEEASYGYELVQRLQKQSSTLFEWQEGTVYPVLHRLKAEGLVRAQWQDADAAETGRKRKYYYITAKGRSALTEQKAKWEAFHQMIGRVTGKGGKAAGSGAAAVV